MKPFIIDIDEILRETQNRAPQYSVYNQPSSKTVLITQVPISIDMLGKMNMLHEGSFSNLEDACELAERVKAESEDEDEDLGFYSIDFQ